MAGEWVRSSWDFSPLALGHGGPTIVKAFHSLLTQCGWELAPWDSLDDDRTYLRSDRATLVITHNVVNTGNVAITKVGANITVTGMAGGSSTTKATGTVNLTGLPVDGNTITVSDGTLTKTYEFDGDSTVAGGNIAVQLYTSRVRCMESLAAAINASGQALSAAALTKRWRYNGDGVDVDCGIRVRWDSGNSRVAISTFTATPSGGGIGYEPSTLQEIRIAYNLTTINHYTFYAGEDGLFFECGTLGGDLPQNVAHGAIMTFSVIPEFHGTRDAKITWTAQGLVCNLFGPLVFGDYASRFVDNNGENKNYTAMLRPHVARGTASLSSPAPSTDASYAIIPRDNLIGVAGGGDGTSSHMLDIACSFGMLNSPVDDRYKLSPIWMLQARDGWYYGTNNNGGTLNVPAQSGYGTMLEPRWLRQINRFVACDQTLLPFNNVTDTVTGKTYHITQLADGGRTTNLAVEYPSTTVTIPATPAV